MPATVSHVLSATTPDDPAYEIRPSHWNSAHAVSLNISATEISGLFSNANGVSFGLSDSSITASIAAGGAPGSISAGTTRFALGEAVFSNSNGISFGLDGATVTAQHNALTSQSNQNVTAGNGGFAFQTLSFSNAGNVSFGTSAGSAITATVTVASTQGSINLSAGTTSNLASAFTFNNANGVSFGLNASTITASVATSLTNIRLSAGTTSNLASAFTFADSNGLSFGLNAGTITGTYYRPVVSNAIQSVGSATGSGTNTSRFAADDHVHAGVFSMGVSTGGNTAGDTRVDVGRFVFAGGNNITLSQATAAGGLNTITISAGAGGGAFTGGMSNIGNTAGTTGTVSQRMLVVGGPNITVSQSIDGHSATLSISGNAPGAAAENNWINLLGANTAGNTTASGSTIGWSGINITLSGTNGSAVNISAPATSSLVGTSGLSVSTNGSTMSVQPIPLSEYAPYDPTAMVTASNLGQNSLYFYPFDLPWPVNAYRMNFFLSVGSTLSASNNTGSGGQTLSAALYTLDAGNTTQISRLWSASAFWSFTNSSNTRLQIAHPAGIANSTSVSSSSVSSASTNVSTYYASSVAGFRMVPLPVSSTLTPGRYWLAVAKSSTSANAQHIMNISVGQLTFGNLIAYRPYGTNSAASNASVFPLMRGAGTYSATSGAFPATIPLTASDIRFGIVATVPFINFSGFTTATNML